MFAQVLLQHGQVQQIQQDLMRRIAERSSGGGEPGAAQQAQHELLRRSSSAEHAGRSSVDVQARTAPPEQG